MTFNCIELQIEWLHNTRILLVNPTSFKNYRHNFPQILMNKTHLDNHTRLLHIKIIDK